MSGKKKYTDGFKLTKFIRCIILKLCEEYVYIVRKTMSVTIKDVAKLANVSIATVSRVINKNYFVSPEIKERVNRAIKELNYYPNSIAQSLKNRSTLTIGFAVSDISNNYFTSMARAVEDVISKHNYNVIVCSTESDQKKELGYLKLLMSKKIDGLILNTSGENDDYVSDLSETIPTVLVNRKVKSARFRGDFIDSDNNQGAYLLTSHLISNGHRKIGVINGNLSLSTGYERFEGFKKAMKDVNIKIDDDYMYRYDGDFSFESGYKGAEYLFSLADRPTAIIAMNNAMAMGAMKFFRNHEIIVPSDISMACYGTISNIELYYIQPSVVTLDPWCIGNKAGELIMERISNPELNNRDVIFMPQLIPGNGVKVI